MQKITDTADAFAGVGVMTPPAEKTNEEKKLVENGINKPIEALTDKEPQ